jgi:hypothetical protein
VYESAASWVSPGTVVAVALNTHGLDDATARHAIQSAARETGLPATDPIRFGADSWSMPSRLIEPRGEVVVRLSVERLDLSTAFEFRITHGGGRGHENTLVRIEHEGITGIGEASPAHYYGENRAAGRSGAGLMGAASRR